MAAKLKVDLLQGILEVEGDESFVREMHELFQTYASRNVPPLHGKTSHQVESEIAPEGVKTASKTGNTKAVRRKRSEPSQAREGSKPTQYTPRTIKDLDLNGLKEYVLTYTLSGHSDKILAFVMFLRDQKNLARCSADQIYTAYRFVGEKTPNAFLQAIRDASKKKDLIDYKSPVDIGVTHIGENRFLHDLPKSG